MQKITKYYSKQKKRPQNNIFRDVLNIFELTTIVRNRSELFRAKIEKKSQKRKKMGKKCPSQKKLVV
jgi:hypothetical protein